MNSLNKYTFLTLIILLIMFLTTFCFANNSYVEEATNVLYKMKIVIGNENGDLMLDNNFTRAEFATVIVRLLDIENTDISNSKLTFNDVKSDFWGYNNIYKCVNNGYLIGDGDGNFRPNDSIKYEEVLTIMIRLLNKDLNLTNWPDDYVNKSEELGITKNTNLEIGTKILRSDSFIIIYNCLNIEI